MRPLRMIVMTMLIAAVLQLGDCRKRRRISEGYYLRRNEIPSLVVVLVNGRIVYSGNLVSSRSVLTAAHNLKYILKGAPKSRYQVLVGVHDIRESYGREHKYRIVGYWMAKHSAEVEPQDDYALLFLDRKIEFSKLGDSVQVARMTTLYPEDLSDCIIAGWGLPQRLNRRGSAVPKKAPVEIYKSQSKCGCAVVEHTSHLPSPKMYGFNIHIMCLNETNGNVCLGDSGGPVMCLHPDYHDMVQIGVIIKAFSKGGGGGCGYGLSIAVSTSLNYLWIRQWMKY